MGTGQTGAQGEFGAMQISIKIRPIAEMELKDAAMWYEQQRPGLGMEFSAAFDQLINQIAESPKQFAVVYQNLRKAKLMRFPYALYYQLEPPVIDIVAVFHQHRDPRIWQQRVD